MTPIERIKSWFSAPQRPSAEQQLARIHSEHQRLAEQVGVVIDSPN